MNDGPYSHLWITNDEWVALGLDAKMRSRFLNVVRGRHAFKIVVEPTYKNRSLVVFQAQGFGPTTLGNFSKLRRAQAEVAVVTLRMLAS